MMKKLRFFMLASLCVAMLSGCSNDNNDPEPPVKEGDFSLTNTQGTNYKDGESVAVSTVNEAGTMRFDFWAKNNTSKEIILTISQKILKTSYDDIKNYAAYCWDACYTSLPSEDHAAELYMMAGELNKDTSGDITIVETTPSFNATIEYTITNKATGEKRTLVGVYSYKKK